jgi:hypothetical protein
VVPPQSAQHPRAGPPYPTPPVTRGVVPPAAITVMLVACVAPGPPGPNPSPIGERRSFVVCPPCESLGIQGNSLCLYQRSYPPIPSDTGRASVGGSDRRSKLMVYLLPLPGHEPGPAVKRRPPSRVVGRPPLVGEHEGTRPHGHYGLFVDFGAEKASQLSGEPGRDPTPTGRACPPTRPAWLAPTRWSAAVPPPAGRVPSRRSMEAGHGPHGKGGCDRPGPPVP